MTSASGGQALSLTKGKGEPATGLAPCQYAYLGIVEYTEALALQRDLAHRRALGEIPDMLLILEHPPVYTTGRRGPGAGRAEARPRAGAGGTEPHAAEV